LIQFVINHIFTVMFHQRLRIAYNIGNDMQQKIFKWNICKFL
jgi:hypothetical protein